MTQFAQSIPKRPQGIFSRLSLFVGAGMVVSLLVLAPAFFLLQLRKGRTDIRSSSRPVVLEPVPETPPSASGQVPILGIDLVPVTPEIAASSGQSRGGYVNAVMPDGPASRGGLQRGDILTGVGSLSIADCLLLRRCLESLPPGSVVTVTIFRDRQERHLKFVLPNATRAPNATGSDKSF